MQNHIYIFPRDLFLNESFTRLDLEIYAEINSLKFGLFTSYEQFRAKYLHCSLPSVKRAIPKLTRAGYLTKIGKCTFSRVAQLEHYKIEIASKLGIKIDTLQIPSIKADTTTVSIPDTSMVSAADAHNSISKSISNKRERECVNFLSDEEFPILSGMLKLNGYDFLSLTNREAISLQETFKKAGYTEFEQSKILESAEAYIRSECLSNPSAKIKLVGRSSSIIQVAIKRFSETSKAQKADKRESTYLKKSKLAKGESDRSKSPARKLYRNTSSNIGMSLINDVASKIGGK